MGRNPELKNPTSKIVIFESDEYNQLREIVGVNNVSKEIRAMIHNFIEKQKKDVAQIDQLNLSRVTKPETVKPLTNDIICVGIYESIDYADTVRKLIKTESDNCKISRAKNNFYDLFRYCEGELRIRKEQILKIKT